MSFMTIKLLFLGLIMSALPNLALARVTGDAMVDAANRQVCGTGELVRAEYIEGGILHVFCRGEPVTNAALEGTVLGGGAGVAGLVSLIIITIVVGDSSDGTTTTTTTTR